MSDLKTVTLPGDVKQHSEFYETNVDDLQENVNNQIVPLNPMDLPLDGLQGGDDVKVVLLERNQTIQLKSSYLMYQIGKRKTKKK